MGYGDYVEQITYLIFLKMAEERDKAGQQVQVSNKFAWARLVKLDGDANIIKTWELQYRHTLESLGKQGGMLGTIFRKAQNKVDAGRPWPAPSGLPSLSKFVPDEFVRTPIRWNA